MFHDKLYNSFYGVYTIPLSVTWKNNIQIGIAIDTNTKPSWVVTWQPDATYNWPRTSWCSLTMSSWPSLNLIVFKKASYSSHLTFSYFFLSINLQHKIWWSYFISYTNQHSVELVMPPRSSPFLAQVLRILCASAARFSKGTVSLRPDISFASVGWG